MKHIHLCNLHTHLCEYMQVIIIFFVIHMATRALRTLFNFCIIHDAQVENYSFRTSIRRTSIRFMLLCRFFAFQFYENWVGCRVFFRQINCLEIFNYTISSETYRSTKYHSMWWKFSIWNYQFVKHKIKPSSSENVIITHIWAHIWCNHIYMHLRSTTMRKPKPLVQNTYILKAHWCSLLWSFSNV